MVKQCLGCVLKHLGAAYVLEHEVRTGYPDYDFKVIGHMEQAEEESYGANKMLAKVIRQHRVNFQYPKNEKEYSIPFEALVEYVKAIATLENEDEAAAQNLVPPKACLVGIDVDEKGLPIFDGDTRP